MQETDEFERLPNFDPLPLEMHDIDGFGHVDLSEDQMQVLSEAFGQGDDYSLQGPSGGKKEQKLPEMHENAVSGAKRPRQSPEMHDGVGSLEVDSGELEEMKNYLDSLGDTFSEKKVAGRPKRPHTAYDGGENLFQVDFFAVRHELDELFTDQGVPGKTIKAK